ARIADARGLSPRRDPHPALRATCSRKGRRQKEKGRPCGRPFLARSPPLVRGVAGDFGAAAPHIDADEQEQPDHVDEMPVPGGELEAEMLLRRELAGIGAQQADQQEDGSDQHMEAVEAGRHEEGRAVDVAGEVERGVCIFIGLHAGEAGTEQHGEDQA
ncbi:hypothetical protein KXW38_002127, partial [Aspergillus fumigatus]